MLMNFLAHFYLSGQDEELLTGNFLGDFVKGNDLVQFPEGVVKGIRMHQSIDQFTDSHEITLRSKKRISHKYGHYSAVIIDIFYDHFLAKLWDQFHDQDLLYFTEDSYKILDKYSHLFPKKAFYVYPYMKNGNWLLRYGTLEGISRTLNGMARRARFNSKMDEAIEDLKIHYDDFRKDFEEFFPTLQAHCNEFLKLKNGTIQ